MAKRRGILVRRLRMLHLVSKALHAVRGSCPWMCAKTQLRLLRTRRSVKSVRQPLVLRLQHRSHALSRDIPTRLGKWRICSDNVAQSYRT